MKIKENKAMRLASVLLVLTLLTTSLTAGTFAKYTTGKKGNAEARVAKFGVEVTADATNIFGDKYDANGVAYAEGDTVTVTADTDVVAPGTNGSMTFSVTGTPETKVKLEVSVESTKQVMLAAKSYTTNAGPANVNVEYKPIKWTLTKGREAIDECTDTTLDAINTYLSGTSFTKEYAAGTDLGQSIDYTLSWEWAFNENNMDASTADTILGDISADRDSVTDSTNVDLKEGTDYNLNEAFNFEIKVTQAD